MLLTPLRVPIIFLVVIAEFSCGIAAGGTIIVPSGAAGGQANTAPFDVPSGGTMRYQQVYGGSDFGYTGSHDITAIMFRDNPTGSAFQGTIGNIEIHLSTSSRTPDVLSSTFADNVGTDDQVVYSGPLTLSSNEPPENGTKPFDITIPLQHPFSFDPSAGNLLLDVRNFTGGHTADFDFSSSSSDSVSRVFAANVNSTTAGDVDSGGLITQFTVTGVPEPALGLIPLAALVTPWRRRTGLAG